MHVCVIDEAYAAGHAEGMAEGLVLGAEQIEEQMADFVLWCELERKYWSEIYPGGGGDAAMQNALDWIAERAASHA